MQFLLDRFKDAHDKLAFVDNGQKFTYGEILEKINEYTNILNKNKIEPGQVVLIVADYSPQLFCLMLALMQNKNIIAPLTRDSIIEKKTVLEISEAQVFIDFSTHINEIKIEKTDLNPTNQLLVGFIKQNEPGLLLFSSGSTGKPKAILHNFNRVLEKFKTKRSACTAITFLMLDHFGGINTLLHLLSNLGTVVTIKNRSVQSICECIQNNKVELLPTTPSFLNMLVSSNITDKYDLSSLTQITYGTEVMPQVTLDRLQKLFPKVKLQQTYGLSELGVLRSHSRPDGSLWVKIGGDGFKTKVIDDILWIKSDYAMLGYLNAPSPFDSEGWFNTQDRVEVDGEYFKILGRVTDLMNIGGQKVYPSEIEDIIIAMDNIEDVAVYSEKNGLLGQIIVAEVITKTDETLDSVKKRIRKYCSERLASFKVPSKIVISDRNLYSSRLKKLRKAKEEKLAPSSV